MTEAELCLKFREFIEPLGFKTYPEYFGYDFCALRNNIWVGFQAKRKLTVEVVSQAVLSVPRVHFKAVLFEETPKKNFWHLLNICRQLKIIPIRVFPAGNIFLDYFVDFDTRLNHNPFWYFYLRPDRVLPEQEGLFNIPAGAKAPLRLTERNLALCNLEKTALTRENNCVTIQDAWDVGLNKLPHYYYHYDFDTKCWRLRDKPRASMDYPHVWSGIK